MNFQFLKNFALVVLLIFLASFVTNVTAKKPSPTEDLVYTADNYYLLKESIDSYGANKLQIVFRHAKMDLSDLTEGKVTFDSGNSCVPGPISGQGIMTLQPKSKKVPTVAMLQYWFEGELESLDVVTYLLQMEGLFDELDNWPPTEADPVTTLSFNYWELKAENKWAQKQDCSGAFFDGDYPWTVEVELQLPE